TVFFKPFGNLQIRNQLLIAQDEGFMKLYDEPAETLLRHTPDSVKENPLVEFIRALPSILKICWTKYILVLLQVCGNMSDAALTYYWAQIATAFRDLRAFTQFLRRSFARYDPLRIWHLIFGLLLF